MTPIRIARSDTQSERLCTASATTAWLEPIVRFAVATGMRQGEICSLTRASYQVDQQERGVVLRFGKFHETVQPGLQWNPPLIDSVTRVNTTKVRAASFREIMLTQDENIVEAQLSLQYVIDDPTSFVLRVRDPEVSLHSLFAGRGRELFRRQGRDRRLSEFHRPGGPV